MRNLLDNVPPYSVFRSTTARGRKAGRSLAQPVPMQQPQGLGGRFIPGFRKPVAAVVVVETRQQRRHNARMLAKAAKVWADVTDGAGVVLVDGEPVKPAKEAGHG